MVTATGTSELHLGEGDFPPQLDRVNYGAFLLSFLWAPAHRLWGWFAVFVALEALESAIGFNAPILGGVFEQPLALLAFRIVYWAITLWFALQANRLAWSVARKRAESSRPTPTLARYAAHQRAWTVAGIVLLAAAPLSLLVESVRTMPGAVGDVVATVAAQAVLLAALFVYDRVRVPRAQQ